MDLTSLQKQSPSGGFGNSRNCLCAPPPAQDPHLDVRRDLRGAAAPARSRTTPPRRCWSCRRDQDLPELQVPRAGRALGRALPGELGELGGTETLTGTVQPCSRSVGSHFLTEVEPIHLPILGVPLSLLLYLGSLNSHSLPIPAFSASLSLILGVSPSLLSSLLPHFPPVPQPWLVAAGCHGVPWAEGGMLPFQ